MVVTRFHATYLRHLTAVVVSLRMTSQHSDRVCCRSGVHLVVPEGKPVSERDRRTYLRAVIQLVETAITESRSPDLISRKYEGSGSNLIRRVGISVGKSLYHSLSDCRTI